MEKENQQKCMTLKVWIDGKTYRRFAGFDTILRNRKWVRPAIFAAAFCLFAVVCFSMLGKAPQAGLLGGVLLAVGLGLPLVYFGSFFQSVENRIKQMKLKGQKRWAYTLTFTDAPEGIKAETPGGQASVYAWKKAAVYFRKRAIYLYVADTKAYILPNDAMEGQRAELETLMNQKMEPERLHR